MTTATREHDFSPTAFTPSADPSERALVARLKAGDEGAYEELIRTLGGRLLAVARRLLRDEDAARDAVQDAMLCAVRGIQRFDEQARLSTWLHRIVVNAALMKIRTRQRKPEQSLEPLLPAFDGSGRHAEPATSWRESAEAMLGQEEMRLILRAAIDELPDNYRAVVLMRDIEGLSTLEAAEAAGISENALKLRLHRARQALATLVRRRIEAHGRVRRMPAAAATARSVATRRDRFRAPAIPLAV